MEIICDIARIVTRRIERGQTQASIEREFSLPAKYISDFVNGKRSPKQLNNYYRKKMEKIAAEEAGDTTYDNNNNAQNYAHRLPREQAMGRWHCPCCAKRHNGLKLEATVNNRIVRFCQESCLTYYTSDPSCKHAIEVHHDKP